MDDRRFFRENRTPRVSQPTFADNVPGMKVSDVTAKELSDLRYHLYKWRTSFAPRMTIRSYERAEDIPDAAVRRQIEKRQRINGWYDALTGEVSVYLPNIALDRHPHARLEMVLFHEVVAHHGLRSLLGDAAYGKFCGEVYDSLDVRSKRHWAEYAGGDGDAAERDVRIRAGAEYVAHVAETLAVDSNFMSDSTTAEWKDVMGVLTEQNPVLKKGATRESTCLYDNVLRQVLGMAVHHLAVQKRYQMPQMSRDGISEMMDAQLDELKPMHDNIVERDLKKTFKLGRVGNILLNSSPSVQDFPLEMRTGALWGRTWDDKQDELRHPFPLDAIKGFVKMLGEPLAVFESKQESKSDSVIAVLPLSFRDSRGRDCTFVVPLTPKVNRDGVPVMSIDSIYPKANRDILHWVAGKRMLTDKRTGLPMTDGEGRYITRTLLRWASDEFVNDWYPKAEKTAREDLDRRREEAGKLKPSGVQLVDPADYTGGLAALEKEAERFNSETLMATKVMGFLDKSKSPGENFRLFSREKAEMSVSVYDGDIVPEKDVVFVFGNNPGGRHGAGAAKVAAERFGAKYGLGEGLWGNSYALPTKDLGKSRVLGLYTAYSSKWKEMVAAVRKHYENASYDEIMTNNPYPRSISPERIVDSIVELYRTAEVHPEKTFRVAYRNGKDEFSLNGYCGGEMAAMFLQAGREYGIIPPNVEFSRRWVEEGLMKESVQEEIREKKKEDGMSEEQRRVFDLISAALDRAGIPVHYCGGVDMERMLGKYPGADMLTFSSSDSEFPFTMKGAINGKGIVASRLQERSVNVTDIEPHGFDGPFVSALGQTKSWTFENLVKSEYHTAHKGKPEQFTYRINRDIIKKMLSHPATGKSTNLGAHLSVLKSLPSVIENCIDAEIHPDYAKSGGVRVGGMIDDPDMLVHRMYGAVRVEGRVFRVKLTMFEWRSQQRQGGNIRPYTYEINDFRLLDEGLTGEMKLTNAGDDVPIPDPEGVGMPLGNYAYSPTSVVPCAKLLKDIEKSYDPGKKLLEESGKVTGRESRLFVNIARRLHRTVGAKLYGWAAEGEIYLTDEGLNPFVPLHEYTHLWAKTMQMSAPQVWTGIVGMLRPLPIWEDVVHDARYRHISHDDDSIASESLARISSFMNSNRLESFVQRYADRDVDTDRMLDDLKVTLEKMWGWVSASLLETGNHLDPSLVTSRVLYDLVSGTKMVRIENDEPELSLGEDTSEKETQIKNHNAMATEKNSETNAVILRDSAEGPVLTTPSGHEVTLSALAEGMAKMRTEKYVEPFGGSNRVYVTHTSPDVLTSLTENPMFETMDAMGYRPRPSSVDELRRETGLDPLELYLNMLEGNVYSVSQGGAKKEWVFYGHTVEPVTVGEELRARIAEFVPEFMETLKKDTNMETEEIKSEESGRTVAQEAAASVKEDAPAPSRKFTLPVNINMTKVEGYIIPDDFTVIDARAFAGCTALKSVTVPDTVTSIRNGAFANCTALKEISLPSSLVSIGSGAFQNCSSLSSLDIPDTVASIGKTAFDGCDSLEEIRLTSDTYYRLKGSLPFDIQITLTDVSEKARIRAARDIDADSVTVEEEPVVTRAKDRGEFLIPTGLNARESMQANMKAADVTLLVSTDISAGRDRAIASLAGGRYVKDILDFESRPEGAVAFERDIADRARALSEELGSLADAFGFDDSHIRLNVAGSTLPTLEESGITQRMLDRYLTRLISVMNEGGRIHIDHIRTSGQTGAEEAAVQAARALDLSWEVNPVAGYRMRVPDAASPAGFRDTEDEKAFRERFDKPVDGYDAPIGQSINVSAEKDENVSLSDTAPRQFTSPGTTGSYASVAAAVMTAEEVHAKEGVTLGDAETADMLRVFTAESFRQNPEALGELLATVGYDITGDDAAKVTAIEAARANLLAESKVPDIETYRRYARDLAVEATVGGDRFTGKDFCYMLQKELPSPDMELFRRMACDYAKQMHPSGFGAETVRFHNSVIETYINAQNMYEAKREIDIETVREALLTNEASVLTLAVRHALSDDPVSIRDRILDMPDVEPEKREQYPVTLDTWISVVQRRSGVLKENEGKEVIPETKVEFADDNIPGLDYEDSGRDEEVREEKKEEEAPARKPVPAGRGRIYYVGMGTRTAEDFYSHLPKSVTHVIDIRSYNVNTKYPQFNGRPMRERLGRSGIQYENVKALSGKTEDRHFLRDGKVVDYTKYALSVECAKAVADIESALDRGESILLTDTPSDPRRSAASLLVGQALARDGYDMTHIDQGVGGKWRIRSQEDIVASAIGGRDIIGGDHTAVHFASDGKWTLDEGVRLGGRRQSVSKSEKLIEGRWNHGTKAEFTASDSDSLLSVNEENVNAADYTVVFVSSRPSENEMHTLAYAGKAGAVKVSIPEDSDRLYDEDFREKTAAKIAEKMGRSLLHGSGIDLQNIRLHIQGPDEPHIEMRFVEGRPTEEELSGRDREMLVRTGYKLDDFSPESQENVNDFVAGVLAHLAGRLDMLGRNPDFPELDTPLKVGTVLTNGESGIGEAALLAGQLHGLGVEVHHTRSASLTFNNETLRGSTVPALAAMHNRAHLGLSGRMTTEDVTENMRRHDATMAEDAMIVGLQSEHIITLDLLGFSNHDILDMVALADQNDVSINSPADMVSFLEDCAANGITGAERITPEDVEHRYAEAAVVIEEARARGLSLTTIVSGDYPDALRNIVRYPENSTEVMVTVKDGVSSTQTRAVTVYNGSPAFLWYRGDLSVFSGPSVSLLGGGDWSEPEVSVAAREMASRAVSEGALLVVSSMEGPQGDAARYAIDRGGKVAYISNNPVSGTESEGIVDDITRNGGVVVSEKDHRGRSHNRSTAKERKRGTALATGLGAATLILDDMERNVPAVVGDLSALTAAVPVIAVTAAVKRHREKAAEKEKALKAKAKPGEDIATPILEDRLPDITVGTDGEGMTKLLEAAGSVIPEAELSPVPSPSEGVEFAGLGEEPVHVDQKPFKVLRCGSETVFLIKKNYVDVIDLIKKTYGDDARIEDPTREKELTNDFNSRNVDYGHGKVPTMAPTPGTAVLPAVAETDYLYYVDGAIYDRENAPDNTHGLLPLATRRSDAKAFAEFREAAERMRDSLMEQVQLKDLSPVRFAGAFYPVIGKDYVELRQGDELRGRVSLAPNGRFRKDYIPGSVLETKIVRQDSGSGVDIASVRALRDEMNEWLLSSSPKETEAYALSSREERDELDNEVSTGYRKVSENNVTVAQREVAAAVRDGMFPDGKGAAYDPVRAVGLLLARESKIDDELRKLDRKVTETEGRMLDLSERRNDMMIGAASFDAGQKKDLLDDCNRCADELEALRDSRTALEREKGACRFAILDIATAKDVRLGDGVTGKEKNVSLFVDGVAVTVPNTNLTAKRKEEAAALVSDIRDETARKRASYDSFRESLNKPAPVREEKKEVKVTEKETAREEKAEEMKETAKETKKPVVVATFGDMHVIKVDCKFAYADRDLKPVSKFYKEAYAMEGRFGLVRNDDGKWNLVTRDGREHFTVWMDRMKVSEGWCSFALSQNGVNYCNAICMADGKYISEKSRPYIGLMKDGWITVKANGTDAPEVAGKYNYLNVEGKYLLSEWADKAEAFNEGTALYTANGVTRQVDASGTPLGVVKIDGQEVAGNEKDLTHTSTPAGGLKPNNN